MNAARKVALVTGGSRGIGRAVCVKLAEQGMRVAFTFQNREDQALETLKQVQAIKGEAFFLQADCSNSSNVNQLVRYVLERYGVIDVLINNAGVMGDQAVETMTDEEWHRIVQTNLTGAFYACRATIPAMKSRGFGRIVNMSSQAAMTGSMNHAHYASAKAGLLGLTYSLAKELGPYGITVNAVSPGRIETDMLSERSSGRMAEWMKMTPIGRLGTSEEIASAVAFLCSSEASYITGLNMHVNGGLLMG